MMRVLGENYREVDLWICGFGYLKLHSSPTAIVAEHEFPLSFGGETTVALLL